MYTTEYDLIVAEDRAREMQQEMRAIRLARTVHAAPTARPSLLDRLVALVSRVAHIEAPKREVGAAA